ncbi:MAG: hypothetical protein ACI4EN_09645 [Butyrivibrio sp.]
MQLNVKEIADKADMIINGYAFTKEGEYVRVLNLNCVNHAALVHRIILALSFLPLLLIFVISLKV